MSLPTLESVQKLQQALHAKAKGEPTFRFYTLYDKVHRKDVLWTAWRRCRSNGGAPGVDEQTFEDIEAYVAMKWLEELAESLRTKTYQPQAVRRVYREKPDGTKRPLGIPTIRDRVVQTAVLVVLEPIFEADLQPEQYGYRAQRSALEAVLAVKDLLQAGYTDVVDADLSGYFDSIPHAELMACVARRVSDKALLHLVKMWLVAPVEEKDVRGQERLRLTVNRTKTKRCRVPEEKFDFLSYTFGRYYSPRTGGAYLDARPSAKAIHKLCESITEQTSRRYLLLDPRTLVESLNRQLRGWAAYFCHGASQAVALVDRHVTRRLRRWLCRKHKVPSGGYTRFSYDYLTHDLGLVRLPMLRRNLLRANA